MSGRYFLVWLTVVVAFSAVAYLFLSQLEVNTSMKSAIPVQVEKGLEKPLVLESKNGSKEPKISEYNNKLDTSPDQTQDLSIESKFQNVSENVDQAAEPALGASAKRLKQISSELSALIINNPQEIDFAKLDSLLAELEELGGSGGVMGGVSITQLRKLIGQSQKIMELTKSGTTTSGSSGLAQLEDEVKKLQTLQQGIVVEDGNE